jgi:hypothetical protein
MSGAQLRYLFVGRFLDASVIFTALTQPEFGAASCCGSARPLSRKIKLGEISTPIILVILFRRLVLGGADELRVESAAVTPPLFPSLKAQAQRLDISERG